MTLFEAIVTKVRIKLWFQTVGRFRELQARYRLWKYVRTLSPQRQLWANDLRKRLSSGTSSEAARTLRLEIERVNFDALRSIEAIDRIHKEQKST